MVHPTHAQVLKVSSLHRGDNSKFGDILKKGVIRGEESNGMLCSEREMGISDEHEG